MSDMNSADSLRGHTLALTPWSADSDVPNSSRNSSPLYVSRVQSPLIAATNSTPDNSSNLSSKPSSLPSEIVLLIEKLKYELGSLLHDKPETKEVMNHHLQALHTGLEMEWTKQNQSQKEEMKTLNDLFLHLSNEKILLMEEKKQLEATNKLQEMQLVAIENDPNKEGLLCRKLKDKIEKLKQAYDQVACQKQHKEDQMMIEINSLRKQVDTLTSQFALTKAMHQKETKQLVDLIHVKQKDFHQVTQATSKRAIKERSTAATTAILYDPNSLRCIKYEAGNLPKPPSGQTSGCGLTLVGERPRSPKKALVSVQPNAVVTLKSSDGVTTTVVPVEKLETPSGKIVRPFS